MNIKVRIQDIFVSLIGLQLIFYFLNTEKYYQLSGFYYPVLIADIIGVLIFFKNVQKANEYTMISLFLFIYILIRGLGSIDNISFGYFGAYTLMTFMIVIGSTIRYEKRHVITICLSYAFLACVISYLLIFHGINFYPNNLIIRGTINLFGIRVDPNFLSANLVAPTVLFFSLGYYSKEKKKRWGLWIICAFIFYGIIITASRGALSSVVLGIGIVLLFDKYNKKRKIVLALLMLVALIIAVQFIPGEVATRLFRSSWTSDESQVRRFMLWKDAIDVILKAPVFGHGIQDASDIIELYLGKSNPAHNTYLEMTIHLGLLGFVSFLALIILIIKKTKIVFIKATLISSLFVSIFISAEGTFYFWVNIFICIVLSVYLADKEHENELFS